MGLAHDIALATIILGENDDDVSFVMKNLIPSNAERIYLCPRTSLPEWVQGEFNENSTLTRNIRTRNVDKHSARPVPKADDVVQRPTTNNSLTSDKTQSVTLAHKERMWQVGRAGTRRDDVHSIDYKKGASR